MARNETTGGRIRWWVEGEATPLLRKLLADPDRVIQGPGSVARARVGRKRFYLLEAEPGEPDLLVKVFALPSALARLRYLLRPSKARLEAAIAREVRARGFDAAAPVAVGEQRRAGVLLRSFSVIARREGADLSLLLLDPALPRIRRRRLIEALAELARSLHDAGVDQDDFSPNNFLASSDDRLVVLDFERSRVGRPLGDRRFTLLAKLHRHDLGVSAADRLRFLRRYLGPEAGRAERREAWRKIEREFRRIRARDARRAARRAFRPGRHVARHEGGWVVVGREAAPALRFTPGAAGARRTWVRAHQLERLGLPALRPVRLGDGWIDLEDPGGCAPRNPELLAARARRRFAAYGRFVREPEWLYCSRGAVLRDPGAFELEL